MKTPVKKPTPSMLKTAPLVALATAALATNPGQDDLDAARRQLVIDNVSTILQRDYVFPDVARECGAHLSEELQNGSFDELSTPESLAQALTAALQHISKDKHLRVTVRRPEPTQLAREDPAVARMNQMDRMRRRNYGFKRVERMDGNVGYLDLRSFSPLDLAQETAAAAMALLANSDALIFDLRKNGGGDPATVQFLSSYLFSERTHLNSLYFRRGDVTHEFWTTDVPGDRMADVPVFVLTSDFTFSAAEEFTYNLSTRNRATVVGERTGGGAHPGSTQSIDDDFQIFVPGGRAINPVTGTNWEGTGVLPDIAAPSEEALGRALVEARKAAEERRARKRDERNELWAAIRDQLELGDKHCEDGDVAEGTRLVHAALKRASESTLLQEWDINAHGYERLAQERIISAIAIFSFNTDHHPESANAWDSLAEAYMKQGDTNSALKHYKRSLQLDPANSNAALMIERLTK